MLISGCNPHVLKTVLKLHHFEYFTILTRTILIEDSPRTLIGNGEPYVDNQEERPYHQQSHKNNGKVNYALKEVFVHINMFRV